MRTDGVTGSTTIAVYHGAKGLVYISTTGSGTATSVIKQSAWTLDLSTDLVETTSFGDTNKTFVQGLRNVQGTLSGFWDDTESKLFSGSTSTDGVKMYLYPSSLALSKFASGPAWLSVTMETGVADSPHVNASFSANGAWTINF